MYTNIITMLYTQHIPLATPCCEDTNAHVQFTPCGSINSSKWCPIRDQISAVKTLFFHSSWRYHLNTFRPEFYCECDWNSARVIVIVQQIKKWFVGKIIIWRFCFFCYSPVLYIKEDSQQKDIVSHKNTRYQKVCVY